MAKPSSESKIAVAAKAPVKAPSASEMRVAWAQFEAGNNRGARRLAKSVLANTSSSAEAKAEATEMLGRIGYDAGAALSVGGISMAVAVILVLLTVAHKFE